MYDLVLKLNAESGLDSWWSALTRVLRDNYMADRVNLALPADSNDIENVPWGQKATYNVYGQHDEASEELPAITSTNVSRPSNAPQPPLMAEYTRAPRLHILNARPSLESRHSYAGHGPPSREIAPARPALPSRTVSHAPGLFRQDTSSTNTGFSVASSDARHTSMSDPDFSSVGGEHMTSPHVAMFSTLRGLDHEFDPLIDTSGVNKVLERGKMVTLTRDYKLDQGSDTNLTASRVPAETTPTPSGNPQPRTNTDLKGSSKLSSQFRNVFSAADLGKRRGSAYEEYEQQPPSPWSQSPAPSPAIQADPEMNPFFASQDNVDDSFDPAAESPDYERLEAIEAIGVDKATTIIHLPLIHPTLSPLMPGYTEERGQNDKAGLETIERRAPIAIISIQSPAVPYPQNLTHSLKLLGPHLAACYANAYQLTSAQNQAISIRHRRGASGRNVGFAPLSIEPNNLDDLIRGEFNEGSGSFSGSITSPSDYSGRSKHSPASSLAGTPGWDPRSIAGTPAAHSHYEGPEGYFDAKKRSSSHPHRPTSTAGPSTVVTTPAKSGRSSHTDIRSAIKEGMEDDRPPSRLKTSGSIKAEKSPLRMHRENSPHKLPEFNPPQKPSLRSAMTQENYAESAERMHSVLHSYGADFSSSFQSLPAATAGARPGTIPSSVTRQASVSDPDMPPPSERLLRTIIDSLPVQIFTAAPSTGELTWVNSKFLVYRGRDSRQVLKEPWEAIHPDDKVAYMDAWKKALKTGQQLQQKIRLQRFDSNFRWFYARAAPLKDKRQNIVHWIGTNMDIHDQHVAELNSAKQQETAASEAKYRALANSSPQIVFTVNRTKGVTFCNTQWENFSGQSEKIALGLGFMEYVHPEDIVKCRLPTFDEDSGRATNVPTSLPPEPKRAFSSSQASSSSSSAETERAPTSPMHSSPVTQLPQRKLSELATTGILKVSKDADGKQSYSTEVRLRSKEGEYRWHLVRVLLADENTRIDQEETWYGTCTDINDHKTLERDLKETMDEKSRFLSNMSHEIRTPLNGITGMVNFLIDSSLSAEQMEHVNIIRASTEGLRGLINDILDLSKAEAGMIQLNLDWMYIRSLIEEVNDLTSAMALDKGLELNYLVEDDVPSHVKVDRFRVRQILLNVIGNAIKFTQTGEVFIRCKALKGESYKTDDEDMFVQFEIVDTGRGFTDKEAQYLFKRFSQIDGSSTRQHGGTGLGLVISRQLAQLHGGDMTAKGVPGKGSTFMFWIKTALPTATDKPPLPPVTPGPSPMPTMDVKVPTQIPRATNTLLLSSRAKAESPHVIAELTRSPSPYGSPSVSSAGSDPSVQTSRTSIRSTRSSASSIMPEAHFPITSPLKLEMPANGRPSRTDSGDSQVSTASDQSTIPASSIRMLSPGGSILPPMFSILVVCPLKYSREATVQHIDQTLPSNVPHQITSRGSLLECQKMIGGEDPMIFSHVVLVIQSVEEIVAFVDQLQSSPSHATTQIVIITDLAQKRKLIEQSPSTNYEKLDQDNKVRFIFKPLKPSKFGVIFDPGKEREMSTDRNRDSAQQVALTQKQVYEEMKKRIGDKGRRVLLVEDNKVNQMVCFYVIEFRFRANIFAGSAQVLEQGRC